MRLVRHRGVSITQASRDLDVHENVLRKWAMEFSSNPVQAFPGQGQMKPEQAEIERLRREAQKLKAERDILKTAAAYFAKDHTGCSCSWRSTGASGRWHSSARRSVSRAADSLRG